MLRTGTPEGLAAVAVSDRARLFLWSLAVVDVMAFAWMLSTGEWLDGASPLTAVVTLGGHHLLVLWLAVAGFVVLALLTTVSRGLTSVRRVHVPFLVLGAVVSVVALAGALSVVLMTVATVLLVATVGASLVSGRFVFVGGSLLRRR